MTWGGRTVETLVEFDIVDAGRLSVVLASTKSTVGDILECQSRIPLLY